MSTARPVSEEPSDEQQRALTSRILNSERFRKSRKLATFLYFICEQQQKGNAHAINEQLIGTEVFGRSEGYHVGEDSIVRSQARFLRLRLQEYFAHEGADEPVILTIPKGSYIPEFHFRERLTAEAASEPESSQTPAVAEMSASAAPADHQPRPDRSSWKLKAAVAAVVVLGVALFLLWRSQGGAPNVIGSKSVQLRFWSSIFDARRTTILVPADSSLVLMDEVAGHEVQLSDYMSRKYRAEAVPPGMEKIWNVLLASQYTNVVDLKMVEELERLPEVDHSKTQIRFARDVSVSELKQNNVILIGSARANPWVDMFTGFGRFRVGFDPKERINLVENRDPGPGEKARYVEISDNDSHLAYGVIAYLPSLDMESSSLLIGGTSKAGTEAASEFLLSPQFVSFLHTLDKDGSLPHFEVLLSAQNLNGNSYQRSIVCYHRLPDPPDSH